MLNKKDININYFNHGKIENERFWKRLGGKPNLKNKSVLDFGCGLGALCVDIALSEAKNVNGIDLEEWNPASDKALPSNFTSDDLSGRVANKRVLQEEMGLEVNPDKYLLRMVKVSRLTIHLEINLELFVMLVALDRLQLMLESQLRFLLAKTGQSFKLWQLQLMDQEQ